MRILYVISNLTFGGAEKQMVELARQLAGRGHEVAIYTLTRDVPRKPELAGSAVTLIVDQKRTKLDPAVLWRLRKTIDRWRPDVIHGFLFDGDFYSRVAALGSGIPVLNSERSEDYRLSWNQRLAHRLTRRLARDVAAIVRQCDVLYVTSAHEGFPNAVLEAMGLGVPVVSTEYSDIRRILPFAGQVVARHSPDDIARAVMWAYAERDVIAARQKQWVHAYATIEKAAKELERVYGKYVKFNPCVQPA